MTNKRSYTETHRARMRQAGYRDSYVWLPGELHEELVRQVKMGRFPNRSAAIEAAVSQFLQKESDSRA